MSALTPDQIAERLKEDFGSLDYCGITKGDVAALLQRINRAERIEKAARALMDDEATGQDYTPDWTKGFAKALLALAQALSSPQTPEPKDAP